MTTSPEVAPLNPIPCPFCKNAIAPCVVEVRDGTETMGYHVWCDPEHGEGCSAQGPICDFDYEAVEAGDQSRRSSSVPENTSGDAKDAQRWRDFVRGAWVAVSADGDVCMGTLLDAQDDMRGEFPDEMAKLDNDTIDDPPTLTRLFDSRAAMSAPHQEGT